MRSVLLLPFLLVAALCNARAALPPGSNVLPYEIHNTANNESYCQMCAYSAKPATVAAYGNFGDAAFWSDLEKLQALSKAHPDAGIFGQVLDSEDSGAIQAKAKEHGITFPVVFAVDKDWEDTYKVGGVSRTIYYSKRFKIGWSGVGLDDQSLAAIQSRLESDLKS